MDDTGAEMIVPIIGPCEVIHVIGKGRTKIKTPKEFLDRIGLDPRFEIAPLTEDKVHDRLVKSLPSDPQKQTNKVGANIVVI